MWIGLLTALAPAILQIVGFVFKQIGAHDEVMQAYQNLLQAAVNNNLISVQMHDDFLSMREKLKQRIKDEGPPT